MPQTYPYLILTDSTNTVTFLSGTSSGSSYPLMSDTWAPPLAMRKVNQLGGRSPYEDATTEFDISIIGTSAADCFDKLKTLTNLLDQAERWAQGEDVSPVYLKWRAQGSTLAAPLKVLVIGGGLTEPNLTLPASFSDDAGIRFIIRYVRVRTRHRMPWLLSSDGYDENPVVNSSFESFDGSNFASWTQVNSPSISQVATNTYHAQKAARIQNTSTDANRGIYQDITGLTNGASYKVNVWVTRVTGTIRLDAYDGGVFANIVSATASGTSQQKLTVTKTATAGGIRIALTSATAGADATFDACWLELASTATNEYRLKQSEALTATSSSSTNPTVLNAAFVETTPMLSPLKLELSGFHATTTPTLGNGFLLIAKQAGASAWIFKIEAEGMTASGFASQADSANDASGGSVLRYTPASTSEASTGTASITPIMGRRIGVFAVVRNNDATKTYQISATLTKNGESVTTSKTLVDGGATGTNPQAIFIGEAVVRDIAPATVKLNVTASATGSTLDIDYIALICLEDPDVCRAIALSSRSLSGLSGACTLTIDSNPFGQIVNDSYPDTSLTVAAIDSNGLRVYIDYRGDAYLGLKTGGPIGTASTSSTYGIYALLMMTNGSAWVFTNTSNDPISNTLTVTRYPAYITPQ